MGGCKLDCNPFFIFAVSAVFTVSAISFALASREHVSRTDFRIVSDDAAVSCQAIFCSFSVI
jgi:hypothetical protein